MITNYTKNMSERTKYTYYIYVMWNSVPTRFVGRSPDASPTLQLSDDSRESPGSAIKTYISPFYPVPA